GFPQLRLLREGVEHLESNTQIPSDSGNQGLGIILVSDHDTASGFDRVDRVILLFRISSLLELVALFAAQTDRGAECHGPVIQLNPERGVLLIGGWLCV